MPKALRENPITGEVLHQWTVQEYERHDRNLVWHVIMVGLGFALVLYGIFTANFLFSLVIILAGIILYVQSHQDPPQVSFAITELGIIVGARFYAYSELDRFYIVYDPPRVKTLYFETRSAVRPSIRIPLLDEDPVAVRETLLAFLDEDEEKEEEPWTDRFEREWRIH